MLRSANSIVVVIVFTREEAVGPLGRVGTRRQKSNDTIEPSDGNSNRLPSIL